MAYHPLLSRSARPATYMVEARDESGELQPTPIAGEHPLTLDVDKREILTMMTLGTVANGSTRRSSEIVPVAIANPHIA